MPEMAGKFICPDPFGFAAGHNLYAYAHNSPLVYYDPDGEWVHIAAGAGFGAAFGAGAYGLQVWLTDEEWDWAKFAIYTGAGALSGAATAATFGIGGGLAMKGAIAGAVGGGVHGSVSAGGIAAYETGDVRLALREAAIGGTIGALSGAAGGAAGGAVLGKLTGAISPKAWTIAGKVVPQWVRGLTTSVGVGATAGGSSGAVSGGFRGYRADGWDGVLPGSLRGAARGSIAGAAGGGIAFGLGKATDALQRSSWDKNRQNYWKQEERKHGASYSEANRQRMRQGRAPQRVNPKTGQMESMELHHDHVSQRSGLPRTFTDRSWNLKKVWPDEHRAIDPFRR